MAALQNSKKIGASPIGAEDKDVVGVDGVNFGRRVEGAQVIVVANRTGGQGKTLVAQLILAAFKDIRPFCADSRNAAVDGQNGGEQRSKLKRMFPQTTDFGAGPSEDDYKKDPKVYSRFWDPFGMAVLMGDIDVKAEETASQMQGDKPKATFLNRPRVNLGKPMLIDFGANVIDSFLSWAKSSGGPETFNRGRWRPAFDFVVPVVASPQSIGDALSIVRELQAGTCVPVRKIVLVLNEVQGPFSVAGGRAFDDLKMIVEDSGGVLISMPHIDNKALRSFEANDKPVGATRDFNGSSLGERLDVGVFEGNRVFEEINGWVNTMTLKLSEALLPCVDARYLPLEALDESETNGTQPH